MNHSSHQQSVTYSSTFLLGTAEIMFILFLFILATLYLLAVKKTNRKNRKWPISRSIAWISGLISLAIATFIALKFDVHTDFRVHMMNHFLIGMLSPLLIVCSAPVTLLLRTLNVKYARQITKLLKSRINIVVLNPIFTTFLNIGALWLLYLTPLYPLMGHNPLLHWIIHLHFFIAGYLFTLSILYVEPVQHKYSYNFRSIMLIISLAGHGILSKYLYAFPPIGVPRYQAESSGYFMFYAGDIIDVVLIYLLCLGWFRATRPRITIY